MNETPQIGYTLVGTVETDENVVPNEPGSINCGMQERDGFVAQPVVTISVASIEGALRKVKANGGKAVSKKMLVGDMGYAAYLKDAEGNMGGFWQNAGPLLSGNRLSLELENNSD